MELNDVFGLPLLIVGVFTIVYGILSYNYRGGQKYGANPSRDWNFFLKKFWALRTIRNWKKSRKEDIQFDWETDGPKQINDDTCDNLSFYGSNNNNSSLYISFTRRSNRISNVILSLTLEDGTTYQLPNHPGTGFINSSGNTWSAAGLSLTLLETFKRWRIVFNGLLSTVNSDGVEELKHIKFNFVWVLATPPFRVPGDYSDSLLAESIALKPWKDPYWMNEITETPKRGYDQYGCFFGFVTTDEKAEPQPMRLSGFRKRRWQPDVSSFDKYFSFFGTAADGTVFILDIELTKGTTQMKYGNIRMPCGKTLPIESIDMNTQLICGGTTPPKNFTIKLATKTRSFVIYISTNTEAIKSYLGSKPEPWNCDLIPCQIGVSGYQGCGYIQAWGTTTDKNIPTEPIVPDKHLSWLQLEDVSQENTQICASFEEKISSCPALVGGKGASLSLLKSVESKEFNVPNGFCLTSKALETQTEHNVDLAQSIRDIINVGAEYSESKMKEYCKRATALFEKTPVCDSVKEFISSYYEELCKKEQNNNKIFVAVRSSGIGEDSEDLSAAGQNATILGCKSLEEVLVGVQKCWASLFTFQSVEYRRQYGQVVDCGMGVVIQVMVESETAGVMFTRHPNNGNPRELLITSSYGIGESVVSGHVEPDTIIVSVEGGKLKIKSYEVGKKGQKIVLDHTGNQQTLSVTMNEEDGKKGSISEEHCLALAKLGLEQEALWGSPRDIEWAIVKGKIYLLQARPITCLNSWTEFELLHELDSAIMSDDDLMCFSNTGEVLPGAFSPLAQSIITNLLDKSISVMIEPVEAEVRPLYIMTSTHKHVGLNMMNSMLRRMEKEVTIRSKVVDLAVCGRIVTNDKMISVADHRFGLKNANPLISIVTTLYSIWKGRKCVEYGEATSKSLDIKINGDMSAIEMFDEIHRSLATIEIVGLCHCVISGESSASQIIFLMTLLGQSTDFTTANYQDIALVLSSCTDVISGEIPEVLKNISLAIKESGKGPTFSEQKPEDGFEWLKTNIPNVHSMLVKFLQEHGHRSIKEFDVMTNPWILDPVPLIKTLQVSYNVSYKDSKLPSTTDDLISKLNTPTNMVSRNILKFVIPFCQRSVARRERTKAAYVLVLHKLRMAFRQLEKQMLKEWRIPEENLIYMLTQPELERLLKTRDPGLIAKAKLRKRHFAKWDKLEFEELNWGFPQPVVKDDSKFLLMSESSDAVIHGTPVYTGDVVARACVIRDIAKIDELQHGDILVTYSTDIGWSPYFPMLSGVVTELGGLISHGAVVAREYGLPCIVGAQGALSVFKTGDTVLLSATNGVLKKVEFRYF